jgi:hypothetical protein
MLLSLLSDAAVSSVQCCCLFCPMLLSLLSNAAVSSVQCYCLFCPMLLSLLSNAAVSSVQCCQCFLFVLSCYVNHFSYVVKTLDDDINIQSNLNTKATKRPLKGHSNATQRNLKMWPFWPFIYRLKVYALFIKWENEIAL